MHTDLPHSIIFELLETPSPDQQHEEQQQQPLARDAFLPVIMAALDLREEDGQLQTPSGDAVTTYSPGKWTLLALEPGHVPRLATRQGGSVASRVAAVRINPSSYNAASSRPDERALYTVVVVAVVRLGDVGTDLVVHVNRPQVLGETCSVGDGGDLDGAARMALEECPSVVRGAMADMKVVLDGLVVRDWGLFGDQH